MTKTLTTPIYARAPVVLTHFRHENGKQLPKLHNDEDEGRYYGRILRPPYFVFLFLFHKVFKVDGRENCNDRDDGRRDHQLEEGAPSLSVVGMVPERRKKNNSGTRDGELREDCKPIYEEILSKGRNRVVRRMLRCLHQRLFAEIQGVKIGNSPLEMMVATSMSNLPT